MSFARIVQPDTMRVVFMLWKTKTTHHGLFCCMCVDINVHTLHVASLRARNIGSAQTFRTFRYLICYVVAFLKIIEINTLQCGSVEENILLTFAWRDEAKASIIETNDFAFIHRCGKISFLLFKSKNLRENFDE